MMDSILFWNAVALEANRVSHSDPAKMEQTGPPLSSRALAIVHLAMYDAYAGIVTANLIPGFPPYLVGLPPAPASGSERDAVAGAAFTTLSKLFKTQIEFFEAQLSAFDKSNVSYNYGVAVGDALLAHRDADPGVGDNGYMAHNGKCRHRVDPDNPGQGYHAPFYGAQSKGFAISVKHTLHQPPCDNAEYLDALKQVRAKGIKPELMATLPASLFSDKRDAKETTVGIYWAYDGANRLGTPPRQYNQIIRAVAIEQDNDEGQNARLFAFVNAAMGDAGILAWEQKYCHDFWRPVVGIREHDKSFGPMADNPGDAVNDIDDDADPFWLPLGAPSTNKPMMKNFTPQFPAYPSGHATFGAAAFHITRLFYGKGFRAGGTAVITGGNPIIEAGNLVEDDLFHGLGFVSDELNGMNQDNQGTVRPRHVRNFELEVGEEHLSGGLGKMIIENATSRIYLGVHWIFDAFKLTNHKPDFSAAGLEIGGVPLGLKIAEDIFKAGNGIAPKLSTTTPTVVPPEITQPATASGCKDALPATAKARGKKARGKKAKDETAREETEEKQKVEIPYPGNISPR
jgi:vanadium chloroperoxidase